MNRHLRSIKTWKQLMQGIREINLSNQATFMMIQIKLAFHCIQTMFNGVIRAVKDTIMGDIASDWRIMWVAVEKVISRSVLEGILDTR